MAFDEALLAAFFNFPSASRPCRGALSIWIKVAGPALMGLRGSNLAPLPRPQQGLSKEQKAF